MKHHINELKDSLVHSMAHAIAHGMMADYHNFDRQHYLNECKELFITFDIPERQANQLIKIAGRMGVQEYHQMDKESTLSKLIREAHTGAQIHPAHTIIAAQAEELSEALEEMQI